MGIIRRIINCLFCCCRKSGVEDEESCQAVGDPGIVVQNVLGIAEEVHPLLQLPPRVKGRGTIIRDEVWPAPFEFLHRPRAIRRLAPITEEDQVLLERENLEEELKEILDNLVIFEARAKKGAIPRSEFLKICSHFSSQARPLENALSRSPSQVSLRAEETNISAEEEMLGLNSWPVILGNIVW